MVINRTVVFKRHFVREQGKQIQIFSCLLERPLTEYHSVLKIISTKFFIKRNVKRMIFSVVIFGTQLSEKFPTHDLFIESQFSRKCWLHALESITPSYNAISFSNELIHCSNVDFYIGRSLNCWNEVMTIQCRFLVRFDQIQHATSKIVYYLDVFTKRFHSANSKGRCWMNL